MWLHTWSEGAVHSIKRTLVHFPMQSSCILYERLGVDKKVQGSLERAVRQRKSLQAQFLRQFQKVQFPVEIPCLQAQKSRQ